MTEQNLRKQLASMLARLGPVLAEIDRLEGNQSASKPKPYPPAPEKAIMDREKQLGFRFPPSYRAFLSLHNGYTGFNGGDICVLGVSGAGYSKAASQFKSDTAMFEKSFKREGPGVVDKLKENEKSNPEVMYLPNHPPVMTNFNGDSWVFDRNRPGKEDEYEIARVAHGEYVEDRYPSFLHFVEENLRRKTKKLKKLAESSEAATNGKTSKSGSGAGSKTSKSSARKKKQ